METPSTGHRFSLQPIVLAIHLALSGAALAEPAPNELPTGGQTVYGQAVIQQQLNRMEIQQNTQKAIVDWKTFNIGSQAQVNFQQPDASSVALNRVSLGNASVIEGKLTANGQVFLVNPSGVLFGKGAQVDVGGLVATTMKIDPNDFANGNYHFVRDGSTGEVVNQGNLKARDGGYIALIGATVRNEGNIRANGGTVAMAAGDGVRLEFGDGKLVSLQVDPATVKTLVENQQLIQAPDGRVFMTAVAASRLQGAVINNAGAVEASSIQSEGGVIRLTGADQIINTGTLDASGKTAGGTVEIAADSKVSQSGRVKADATDGQGGRIVMAGEDVQVDSGSLTSATGTSGGGEIYVGGGKQGEPLFDSSPNDVTPTKLTSAKSVMIAEGASLDASATRQGKGGTVVGWSTGTTRFGGAIKAEGGADGGDGGFVETSGHQLHIEPKAIVSTLAAHGKTGKWLLDPNDFTIAASGGNMTGAALSNNLVSNNVTINTVTEGTPGGNGDIFVSDVVTWNANQLTLSAERNINVNTNLNGSGDASLALKYGQASPNGGVNDNYFINNAAKINLPSGNHFSTQKGSSGSLINYTVINDLGVANDLGTASLQGMKNNPTGNYALGSDINASPTSGWNAGAGFEPIGNSTTPYAGNFDGLGHTIDQLLINRASDNVGLFGVAGNSGGPANSISHVGLTNANVTGNSQVGILAGLTLPLSNVTYTFSQGKVSGLDSLGGLIGWNRSGRNDDSLSLSNSFSTANVSGRSGLGGLTGINQGNINQTYSQGAVQGDTFVGGLVGAHIGKFVTGSYSTGAVNGKGSVGGLIGSTDSGAVVKSSYSMGAVSGTTVSVGGFVGEMGLGYIHDSYSTGAVNAPSGSSGGFVGRVRNPLSEIYYSFWDTTTSGKADGIGLGSPGISILTGLTTSQMMNPASFPFDTNDGTIPPSTGYVNWNTATWSVPADGNHYPYLNWRFSTAPQVISGVLAGVSNSGQTLQAMQQGKSLDQFVAAYRDQPTASSGVNGFYYFALNNPATTPGGGIANNNSVLLYQSGAVAAPTGSVLKSDGGNLLNVNLNPGALTASSRTGTLGTDDLVTARGISLVDASAPYSVVGQGINLTGSTAFQTSGLSSFVLGGSITTQNAGQTFNSEVTLSRDATLASGSGKISLGGNVTGAHNFGLNTTQAGGFDQGSSVFNVAGLELRGNGTQYTLRNPANQIGQLAGNTGSINLFDSTALTMGNVGISTGLTATGNVLVQTGANADLTLASPIASGAAGDAVTLAAGRNFINNAGSNAITLSSGGRWLIYSQDPNANVFGSASIGYLNSGNNPIWDTAYTGGTVSSVGNRYLFTYQPLLTFTGRVLNKTYGTDVSGVIGTAPYGLVYTADTFQGNGVNVAFTKDQPTASFSGSPTVTSLGASAGATRNGSANGDAIYAIELGTSPSLKALGGYVISPTASFIPGQLIVDPYAITLSASPVSKVYDGTTNVAGAVVNVAQALPNGDTLNPSAPFSFTFDNKNVGSNNKTIASNVPDVSSNAIILSSGGSNANINYTITGNGSNANSGQVVNTQSTITPANLIGVANDKTNTYDGKYFFGGNGVNYSGFVPGDSPSDLNGTLTYSGSSQGARNVGYYEIKPGGQTSNNYVINYKSGNLNINPANLVGIANDQAITYNGLQYAGGNGVKFIGFVGGDGIGDLTGTPSYSGSSQGARNVGSYQITPEGQTAQNYTIRFVSGELNINPANLTLQALPDRKYYDGNTSSNKIPVYTGLVEGDNLSNLSQSFNSSAVGNRQLNVNPNYALFDGNGGKNYSVDLRSAPGVIIALPQPVNGAFIAQEIEPKFGYRYTSNRSGVLALGGCLPQLPGSEYNSVVRSMNVTRDMKYMTECGLNPLDHTAPIRNTESESINIGLAGAGTGMASPNEVPNWQVQEMDAETAFLKRK